MDPKDIRTIELAGQEIRYALLGSADAARTLLVFNGIGASLETVAPFAAHFRNTRILTFDVPGVGGSPAPALPYRFSWLSENIAYNFEDAQAVVNGWMGSVGHRANILDPKVTQIGVAVKVASDGSLYYCQVFGAPASY